MRRAILANLILCASALCLGAARVERPADQFSIVNGVRLHFLDWGGRGDTVLFLPGLGDSAHTFDQFAPRFIDRFRVLGLTRRGQEESEKTATNYETDTLIDDIRAFLDSQHVGCVDLIGHSLAGVEMTRFAIRYPNRVRHIVYLDAAYDMATAYEVATNARLPMKPASDAALESISVGSRQHHLDYRDVGAPALAFFVLYDRPNGTSEWSRLAFAPFEQGYKREQVAMFKRDMKRGRVVEYHDTNHMFFKDPAKVDAVVREIRAFLSIP